MGDKFTNTGFIKVTDHQVDYGSTVGYHTVPQTVVLSGVDVPWTMPQFNGEGRDWEFVDAAEVRQNAPKLLEYSADELSADEIAAAELAKSGPKAEK